MTRDWGGECPLRKQVAASTSEAQGRHREVRSGGRVEQTHAPMNRNRISGVGGDSGRAGQRLRSSSSQGAGINLD
jgi:hypothetical protein